ncbi:MAG: MerR family transcriptional regulator [Balneolaceae bacterium]
MKKLYYTIGEVCKLSGIESHTLRYWERTIPELKPRRSKGGKRQYSEADVALVFQLKDLIVDQKYSTAGAKKAISEVEEPESQDTELSPSLQRDLKEVRTFLKHLSDTL